MTQPTWKTSDGIELYRRRWSVAGDAVTGSLVIVHGLGEHSGRYEHAARHFNRAGWHVHTWDMRGHGLSPGRRGHVSSYERLLDDIHEFVTLVQAENGPHSLGLWGHSLGGNLVLNYMRHHKPASSQMAVVATSPLILPTHPPSRWKRVAGRLLARCWPTFRFQAQIQQSWLSRSEEAQRAWVEDDLKFCWVTAALAVPMLEAGQSLLESPQEPGLATLVMHGTADKITSWEASKQFAQSSGADFKAWDDLRHELHWEPERDDVLDCMLSWLNDHTG